MAKQKTSFTLSAESLRLLKLIAQKNERSQANMVEILIKESAVKHQLK